MGLAVYDLAFDRLDPTHSVCRVNSQISHREFAYFFRAFCRRFIFHII
jgi:hypothetical protein